MHNSWTPPIVAAVLGACTVLVLEKVFRADDAVDINTGDDMDMDQHSPPSKLSAGSLWAKLAQDPHPFTISYGCKEVQGKVCLPLCG
jgi:hypothetical protein